MGSDDDEEQSGRCLVEACCCCYAALDCKNWVIGIKLEEDVLCIRHACCVALNAKPLGCGVTTDENDDDELCKLGFMCCDLGCVKPKTCVSSASAVCCLYEVCSFPCHENYVEGCVCACCFLSCAPSCGCCEPPPECPALNKLCDDEMQAMTMSRE